MIEQYFNPAQQEVNLISARDNVVVGGRGIGKSILHATFNLRNMQRMPGSNGGFVSANTKRCLTNTIPSMLQHWERWGFHRGKHYVIGIKPPKKLGWPDPVIPPSNWGEHHIVLQRLHRHHHLTRPQGHVKLPLARLPRHRRG